MLAIISLNLSTYFQLIATTTVQVAIIPLQASAMVSKLILLQSIPHTTGSDLQI